MQYRRNSLRRLTLVLLRLCALICWLALGAFLPGTVVAGTASWSLTGGGGSEVMAFAVAPDQSGVIYMVTQTSYDAFFHRSDDWGKTWTRIGLKLDCAYGLYSLVVDPRNHSVVYAFAHDCGFIKSTDGGETWTEPRFGFYGNLVIDPWRPDRLVVLDSSATVMSTDGGSTWNPLTVFQRVLADVAFDPNDASRIYGAIADGVYQSTDQGKTWRDVTGTLYDDKANKIRNFQGIIVDPKDTRTLYTWNWTALYKTVDEGAQWVVQNNFEKMGFEPYRFICSPSNGTRLYTVSHSGHVFTSSDSGKNWASIDLNLPLAAPNQLALIAGEPEHLWLGTSHGLFSKAAGPDLWQAHNRGFGHESSVLAVVKGHPGQLYSRSSEGFYRTTDGGDTWFPVRLRGIVTSVVTHPTDPLKAWLVTDVFSYPDNSTEIHETTDGGVSWTRVDPGGLPVYDPRMIGDRADPRVLYLAVGSSLLKSVDEGRSWTKLQPDYGGRILMQDTSLTPALYIHGKTAPLARSTDQGQTWEELGEPGIQLSWLAISPRHPEVLYSISDYSQVNRSTDGGKSWEVMRPGFGYSTILDLVVDPAVDGVLYAADDRHSICVSRDEGRTWAPFEPEFPPADLPINLLLTAEARLYAGTSGDVRHIDLGRNLDFLFPQIGDGEAPGNGRLQTTLQLMNQGSPTEAVISFFDSLGNPMSLALGARPPAAEHRITLGHGQSFSGSTPGIGALNVGYARVSGGPGLAGAAVYSYSQNGTMLFQAGVPSSSRVLNFGLFFDVSQSEDNGFALANTGDVAVDPRLTVFDREGQTVAVRKLSEVLGRSLNPGEHLARYVSEMFPQLLPQGVQNGVIAVQSEQPLSPVSLRQNDQPGVGFPLDVWTLSTFPVLGNLPAWGYNRPFCCTLYNPIVFPQVVDGMSGDVQAKTILRLARIGGNWDEFRIRFVQSDGSVMNVELEGPDVQLNQNAGWWVFKVKPGGSTTLRTKGSGPIKVGYAIIYSTRFEIFGTAFYSWSEKGVKLFETGVPAAEPLTDFTIFFDSEPELLQTGLAMANMGDFDTNVTFRLYDRAGQLKASRTWQSYLLAAHDPAVEKGHRALFVREILPDLDQLDVQGGILTVHSDQPAAAVTIRQRDNPQLGFPDDLYLITVFPVVPGRHDY